MWPQKTQTKKRRLDTNPAVSQELSRISKGIVKREVGSNRIHSPKQNAAPPDDRSCSATRNEFRLLVLLSVQTPSKGSLASTSGGAAIADSLEGQRGSNPPNESARAAAKKRLDESLTSQREQIAWRRHDILVRRYRRNLVGGPSRRCERAGELRSNTSRTRAHRLLPGPKSVLSWTIQSCRCQSARAIRVVSRNHWSRPSKAQTTSATTLTSPLVRVLSPEQK
ncbi:hypothetical protein ABIE49_001469 [Bradyrhizobium sp. OAE829]